MFDRSHLVMFGLLAFAPLACKSEKPQPEPAKAQASAGPASQGNAPHRLDMKPNVERLAAVLAQASAEAAASAAAAAADVPAPPDVAEPPADAKKTASGLSTKVLTAGTGKDHPALADRVKVHYTGWTTDGKMFDSSVKRAEPLTFGVGEVIKGWGEGVQLMVAGEKRRLWIPSALAYGDTPSMGAPRGALTFDIELIEILAAPKVPADLKAAPKTATRTKSGLSYKLLSAGKGTKSPGASDRVSVHYSGWTTDGKMFDSSVSRGRPSSFGVGQVIKGWTEGLQLMHEGDKMRFWIPSTLAYGDKPTRPGAPAGMLVFDVELIQILAAPGAPH